MAREVITLRDVYDIVNRLETKMDERLEKIEDRTQKLENNQSRAAGIASVFAIFVSTASTFLWDRIIGKR